MNHFLHIEERPNYRVITCECGACWTATWFDYWHYEPGNKLTVDCSCRLSVRSFNEADEKQKPAQPDQQYPLFQ